MKKKTKQQDEIEQTLRETGKDEIPSDVLGSYTGMGTDGDSPEQDADDL